MIQIVNIGGNPLGVCKYSLRINNTELCQFEHNRTKGLSDCLVEASKAYTMHKWLEFTQEIVEAK